jgi:hypothetical protein
MKNPAIRSASNRYPLIYIMRGEKKFHVTFQQFRPPPLLVSRPRVYNR